MNLLTQNRIVEIVRQARAEGWYADAPGWAEVDRLLVQCDTCRSLGRRRPYDLDGLTCAECGRTFVPFQGPPSRRCLPIRS